MPVHIVVPVTVVCVIVAFFVIATTVLILKKKQEKNNVAAPSQNTRSTHAHDIVAFSRGSQRTVIPTPPVSTQFSQGETLPRRLPPLDHNRPADRGASSVRGTGSRPTNVSQPPVAGESNLPDRGPGTELPPYRTPHEAPPSYDEAVLSSAVA